mgnify:CR=1 FL=1
MHYIEESLLEGIRLHDSDTLEYIYKKFYPSVQAFVNNNSGNDDDARDIFQEAIVHVWRKRDIFQRIEPGLVYLQIKRIAINRARQDLRRKKREELYAEDKRPAFEHPAETGFSIEVEHALRELPLEQREVIVLKVWGEQTFEAIGESLEISPNTAASRYRYGLDRMRRILKGELS